MTTTTPTPALNGVNTGALFGTLDAVRSQPDLPAFSSAPRPGGSAAPTIGPL